MTLTSKTPPSNLPVRGEVWRVNFNTPHTASTPPDGTPKDQLPTTGDEIYKIRPAVVISIAAPWKLKLYLVVPLTGWQDYYETQQYFWMVKIPAVATNRLSKDSAASAFQVKSVAIERFKGKMGILKQDEIDEIAAAITLCIGYTPPKLPTTS